MPEAEQNREDADLVHELARQAGKIAMDWFGDEPKVWMKEGQSPVSEADFAVDNFLRTELLKHRPSYGWLSEETEDTGDRLSARRTFVVDPIDGTRGFIAGSKQWCISIAIVEERRPVVGVLDCPALDRTISATLGEGLRVNGDASSLEEVETGNALRISGPKQLKDSFATLTSRSVEVHPFVPSLAYRMAMVACGELDVAMARKSAKDWDLAAADLIVHEAGGRLTQLDGSLPSYNCSDVRHEALLAAPAHRHNEMLDLARQAMNNNFK